jgi:Tol biopolymer transport system component
VGSAGLLSRGKGAVGPPLVALLATLAVAVPVALAASAARTRRVDVSSSGAQATGGSAFTPTGNAISANGRIVAFSSAATDLVPGDTNAAYDVFVRDRPNHTTRRVSVSSSGQQANGDSFECAISPDGRFVAFASTADNLVSGDTNGHEDIFVRDTQTNTTRRVSVSSSGQQANGDSFKCAISMDGRFVAFESAATNLVPGGTTGDQVFMRDTKTHKTILISESSSGGQPNDQSFDPSISADGRFVAFDSLASNLASGDTNGFTDVFVRDTQTHTTRRVSVSSSGQQGNGFSFTPSISATGRFVAFASQASNLVKGDTNGFQDVFVRDLQNHTTRRASLSSTGQQGNNSSFLVDPAITPDGRYVVFTSVATNLIASGTSGEQVFWRDMVNKKTKLVSRSSSGQQANSSSYDASISTGGRLAAFDSNATNLVAGDTNGFPDIFVRGPLH